MSNEVKPIKPKKQIFSKSLFKQSNKASSTMWTIVTGAVCFMLACVMLIAGGGNLAETKVAIQDSIIEGELTSQMQKRALNYYYTSNEALKCFDESFKSGYNTISNSEDANKVFQSKYTELVNSGVNDLEAKVLAGKAKAEFASKKAYLNALGKVNEFIDNWVSLSGFEKDSDEFKNMKTELTGLVFMVLNPPDENDMTKGKFDAFYISNGEEAPRYDFQSLIFETDTKTRDEYRENYVTKNSVIFLSGNIINDENINLILNELASFGVTREKYEEFGFDKYNKVKNIAASALIDFRANYGYRLEHLEEGETEESVRAEVIDGITMSLLASLPEEVSDALEEIGQADLYGTLVGSIFFKMAGLLLPIIFIIMTANALIAGQVDSGSMAYILSSSVKRRTVTFTQATYLVLSLFAMFCCTTVTSCICLACIDVETKLTYGKLILINIGAFLVMFAMSGICFMTSCWFNRSKRSMGIGGGLNMFFLVATMLGLFGSPVLPKIIRMETLNMFNYVSIISLFDVVSIIEGGFDFIWKLGILFVIGIVCYVIGGEKFVRKDLPL